MRRMEAPWRSRMLDTRAPVHLRQLVHWHVWRCGAEGALCQLRSYLYLHIQLSIDL